MKRLLLQIPNDFLIDSCKCAASSSKSSAWQACKCDVDVSSATSFFNRIGLPMYGELAARKCQLSGATSEQFFKDLFQMSAPQIELEYQIENPLHVSIIESTIQTAKSYLS